MHPHKHLRYYRDVAPYITQDHHERLLTIKLSTHKVLVEDHYVRYQVTGEGEPVILVHGLSGSGRWWVRNIPDLARQYRVYLIDLPGFGTMRRERNLFALSRAADWLAKWMAALDLRRAHFIGHSMGGYICALLAAQRPEMVSRLVLVAPAILPEKHAVFYYLPPLVRGARYLTPSFFPILAYDALRAGPIMLLRAARDLLAQDVHEKVRAINVPTLLIWGENDTLVPLALAPVLHNEIANSRLLVLKRAGHVCMYDRAREFNASVLAFLHGDDRESRL